MKFRVPPKYPFKDTSFVNIYTLDIEEIDKEKTFFQNLVDKFETIMKYWGHDIWIPPASVEEFLKNIRFTFDYFYESGKELNVSVLCNLNKHHKDVKSELKKYQKELQDYNKWYKENEKEILNHKKELEKKKLEKAKKAAETRKRNAEKRKLKEEIKEKALLKKLKKKYEK